MNTISVAVQRLMWRWPGSIPSRQFGVQATSADCIIGIPGCQHRSALCRFCSASGSEGIGKAVAAELAGVGLNVVLVSRSQDKLDAAADEIKQKHPAVQVCSCYHRITLTLVLLRQHSHMAITFCVPACCYSLLLRQCMFMYQPRLAKYVSILVPGLHLRKQHSCRSSAAQEMWHVGGPSSGTLHSV